MKFGNTLRRLRKDKKLTLSDISRESGIHKIKEDKGARHFWRGQVEGKDA